MGDVPLLLVDGHNLLFRACFGTPAQIGNLLLERFLVVFEAASMLLLVAAVGAIVLAGRSRERSG